MQAAKRLKFEQIEVMIYNFSVQAECTFALIFIGTTKKDVDRLIKSM